MAGRLAALGLSRPDLVVWRRRLIVVGLIAAVLAAVYFLWFRDSSLVAVDEVKVQGVTANAEEITAALERVGGEQTTLHVDDGELADAVSRFPTVASIRADASIPDKLTIVVTERPPVAAAKVEGRRVAVSGEGFILLGVEAERDLPVLEVKAPPEEGTVQLDEEATAQAEILGAAPESLRKFLVGASWQEDHDGVVVEMEGAPELRFGPAEDAEEKWRTAAAVLASPDVDAPSYVDVSVPGRVASG
jgi:cell division protein FtsQ